MHGNVKKKLETKKVKRIQVKEKVKQEFKKKIILYKQKVLLHIKYNDMQ